MVITEYLMIPALVEGGSGALGVLHLDEAHTIALHVERAQMLVPHVDGSHTKIL